MHREKAICHAYGRAARQRDLPCRRAALLRKGEDGAQLVAANILASDAERVRHAQQHTRLHGAAQGAEGRKRQRDAAIILLCGGEESLCLPLDRIVERDERARRCGDVLACAGVERLKPRQDLKAQEVPRGGVRVCVGAILNMRNVVRMRIGGEFRTRLLQKRTNEIALLWPHAAKTV